MADYVCKGAKLRCSMGSAQSQLQILPDRRVDLGNNGMANIMDNRPIVNIPPLGLCQSLTNPAVALATTVAMGVLTPMPCMPNISAPWTGGESGVLVKGQIALLNDCKLMCAWSGVIDIVQNGQ